MLDQSFSLKNFQEIFDNENRKGNNIEKRFNDDFSDSIQKINDLKNIRKDIQNATDLDVKKVLYKRKKELKKERDSIVASILERTSEKINKHVITLEIGAFHGGQSYVFEEKIENFFISKKIQDNINKTYDVKQSSRYSILSELINILEDKFPKYVIRTDIKNFYESIPQKKLLDKINDDYLLSIKTKDYINQIFASYNDLTGQTDKETAKGVPRGIGISAYLSELFMRKIDNRIKELTDLIYYARYVDDIIIIFIPKTTNNESQFYKEYLKSIKKIIKEEAGNDFIINEEKTEEYNLMNGITSLELEKKYYVNKVLNDKEIKSNPRSINFLGYQIGTLINIYKKTEIDNLGNTVEVNDGKTTNELCVTLSENKVNKYLEKLKLSFQYFKTKKNHNRKQAFKLLCARINYLTSNTKLRNNKDKVFVGIYYSNPFLNSETSLEKLQTRLKWYISRAGLSPNEKKTIEKYSFIEGFQNKAFQLLPLKNKKYKTHNRKRADINNRLNKGILQFGITEINSIWKK